MKALSQDAKHAKISTFTVKTSKAQLSRLGFAFHMQDWFNWGTDGQQVSFLRFGMVCCFMFIFYFLRPILCIYICAHSGCSFLCVRSPHATREADSEVFPIIFVTDLQQLLKIETSLQYHQTATAGSHNRLSSNHIGSQMRPKCSVSGQSNAQYPFQFAFITNFNIIFTIKGTLITLRIIPYTYGIFLTTVICFAKYFMRHLEASAQIQY